VSSTISGGVADPLRFANTPDIFAYGKQAYGCKEPPCDHTLCITLSDSPASCPESTVTKQHVVLRSTLG
jgi:hypothetical protein